MSPYIALIAGCFFGVLIGFRAGVELMCAKASNEYVRGYKEALNWSRAEIGISGNANINAKRSALDTDGR